MIYFRWLLVIMMGLAAGLWETAVLPFLPAVFAFRPLLTVSVIFLVSSSRNKALAAAFVGAAFLDAYGWSQTGFTILRYSVIVLLLSYVSERFLTNRSVYATAALAILARGLDLASASITVAIGYWLGFSSQPWQWPSGMLWTFAWDGLIAAGAFMVIAGVSKRFVR